MGVLSIEKSYFPKSCSGFWKKQFTNNKKCRERIRKNQFREAKKFNIYRVENEKQYIDTATKTYNIPCLKEKHYIVRLKVVKIMVYVVRNICIVAF